MVNFDTLTTEEYLAHMKMMFMQPGWEILKQELKDQAILINDVQETVNEQDLFYRRGQLAVIANILTLETQVESVEAEADDESPE